MKPAAMEPAPGKGVATQSGKGPTGTKGGGKKMPKDITTDLKHEWPDEPTNTGGQEAVPGHPGALKEPREGRESPAQIAAQMEAEPSLQEFFDGYAHQASLVSLEDFQAILEANGSTAKIGEETFRGLLAANPEFMFQEHSDVAGKFWVPALLEADHHDEEEEHCPHCHKPMGKCVCEAAEHEEEEEHCPHCHKVLDKCVCEATEHCPHCHKPKDECECEEDCESLEVRPTVEGRDRRDAVISAGNATGAGLITEELIAETCEICGAQLDELGCPRCDLATEEVIDSDLTTIREAGKDAMEAPWGQGVASGKAKDDSGLPTAETDTCDMGKEWPRKQTYTGSQQEEDGKSTSGKPDDGYQDKVGHDWPAEPKNKGGQEEFEHGGAGKMTGGAKKMYENVAKLARSIKQQLADYTRQLIESGRISPDARLHASFTISSNNVEPRIHEELSTALVDTEELIQAYGPKNVSFEAKFCDGRGCMVLQKEVPLLTLQQRAPIMAESKVLFRFAEVADRFADRVVSEGRSCSLNAHNWGTAVAVRLSPDEAKRLFHTMH